MNRRRARILALVGWFLVLAGGTSARAQPGDRDPDFDAGRWPLGYQAAAAVVQSDGSVVLAGTAAPNSEEHYGLAPGKWVSRRSQTHEYHARKALVRFPELRSKGFRPKISSHSTIVADLYWNWYIDGV